jgi:hypothetical protein
VAGQLVSYSLYLSHAVITASVVFMLDSSGDSSQFSSWLILPLTAAALPVAWLLYTCVEEPSRRYLCCLGDGAQAPTDSGSAWGSFVVADTERLSNNASDDGRATLLEGNVRLPRVRAGVTYRETLLQTLHGYCSIPRLALRPGSHRSQSGT